jgi:SAM-dependent methyltransferase
MNFKITQILFLLCQSVLFLMTIPQCTAAQDVDVPFVATPYDVVEEMLNLAIVGEGDYVIDLGSGDGRLVIEAAKRGAVGHGVDLDAELVAKSFQNALQEGVENRVMFKVEDVFETDFSMATVIMIYMSPSVNLRLRPQFLERLRPGSRVVSHVFSMGSWAPDMQTEVGRHNVYGWIIPAAVNGEWFWEMNGEEFQLYLGQSFQKIDDADFMPITNEQKWSAVKAEVRGERITIVAENAERGIRHVYSGRVEGGEIHGIVQIHGKNSFKTEKWHAISNKIEAE